MSFETAIAGFVDQTGRTGPSSWYVGSFPEGEDNIPVGGISWYEAAAYACFAGKSLPTVYHWYMAADPFNFLPRITIPTLMINGRYDSFFPLETSIKPFFETIGTNAADKKLIVTDANHFVLAYSAKLAIGETLSWLDHYLGPVD